ncbi:MAG: ATP-binding protein [Paraglaciecola polaris]|uniref:ATP-binding protein n=1 Tax=Paraglaciecola polaris TaxID=222814 RepID=UPI0030018D70|tara:strand:- start:7568 stop:8992 length:1425 start_codon:yes stop_codon:yes gene_type:complete
MYFRTRIFAISILTVSVVLTVVITLSWSRIMKVELDHLDSRLCMEAKRMAPRLDAKGEARKLLASSGSELPDDKLIDDLVDKLRVSSPNQLMVYVASSALGMLRASEGADVQDIIGTLNWGNTDEFKSTNNKPNNAVCQFVFFTHKQTQWRASSFYASQIKSVIAVDVAATTSELKNTLRAALIVIVPLSLLLSIMGARFIATYTMRPINRLHKSMDKVTKKDLSHGLPQHKEDQEFKVLIDTYNTMLNRLEESFQQTSRFTADAAHELKTPLTVLRGKLEQAVLSEDTSQLDVNVILDEVGYLSSITRKLLLLSQADSGSMALYLESINMSDLLDELTTDLELLSDEVVLHCSIKRGLMLKGDIVLLKQLLNNLLVNVMCYSLHEKGVTIKAKQSAACIEVVISNFCSPMLKDVRRQLFERFYRGEPEHTQGISGSGLGLSLAREIARAHGGELRLEPSENDLFVMRLQLPIF